MKTLSVTDIAGEDEFFYVGELRMVQFYRKNLSNAWTQDSTIMDFCATTIQLAIENLIMHKVLTCRTDHTETRFLYFFKSMDTVDYVSFDERLIKEKPLGYLEKRLLDIISKRAGFTLADYINSIFHQILPDKEYSRPAMQVIHQIICNNALDLWDYSDKKTWLLSDRVDLTITEHQEEKLVTQLNTAVRPIIVERNGNSEFRLLSTRSYNEIYAQLSRREIKNDS
jgi:hypothetical protein